MRLTEVAIVQQHIGRRGTEKSCDSLFFRKPQPGNWRRGRDSNPRGIAPKLISSQPRYDHFDTSPYEKLLKILSEIRENFGRELRAYLISNLAESLLYQGFREGMFHEAYRISSQPRYDHFDTSPYSMLGYYNRTYMLCQYPVPIIFSPRTPSTP